MLSTEEEARIIAKAEKAAKELSEALNELNDTLIHMGIRFGVPLDELKNKS